MTEAVATDAGAEPQVVSIETLESGDSTTRAVASRPGILQLAIKEKAALYAAYMPFVKGGGIFVPTLRTAHIGDELYLILTLMDDPNKLAITGRVVWITPHGVPGRQQGIGIQFVQDDSGEVARARIETLLGGNLKSSRGTHTI